MGPYLDVLASRLLQLGYSRPVGALQSTSTRGAIKSDDLERDIATIRNASRQ